MESCYGMPAADERSAFSLSFIVSLFRQPYPSVSVRSNDGAALDGAGPETVESSCDILLN